MNIFSIFGALGVSSASHGSSQLTLTPFNGYLNVSQLTWDVTTGADNISYEIFVADNDGFGQPLAGYTSLGSTPNPFFDVTINSGESKLFLVQASGTGAAVLDWIPGALAVSVPPGAFGITMTDVGGDYATIYWDEAIGAEGYIVYSCDDGSGTNPVYITQEAVGVGFYSIGGLTPSTNYYFFVAALGAQGMSSTNTVVQQITTLTM